MKQHPLSKVPLAELASDTTPRFQLSYHCRKCDLTRTPDMQTLKDFYSPTDTIETIQKDHQCLVCGSKKNCDWTLFILDID